MKKKTPKEPKDFSIQIHNGVHAYWVGRVGFKNIRRIMINFYFQRLELYTCTTFLFQKHVKSVCIPNSIVYAKPSQNTDMSCLDNDTNIIILYMLLFIYRKWKKTHQIMFIYIYSLFGVVYGGIIYKQQWVHRQHRPSNQATTHCRAKHHIFLLLYRVFPKTVIYL